MITRQTRLVVRLILVWAACLSAPAISQTQTDGPPPPTAPAPTVHYTFDSDRGLVIANSDKGLKVAVQNGELRVWGKTTDTNWNDDGVDAAVNDLGGSLDMAVDFKLPQREEYGLVYMGIWPEGEAGRPMILYQWQPQRPGWWFMGSGRSRGWYQVHTMWVETKWWLEKGRGRYPDVGTEDSQFVTMRMYLRENRRQIDYYVNEVLVDTLNLEKPVGQVGRLRVAMETPKSGYRYDLRIDNLKISSCPPSRHPSACFSFGPVKEQVLNEADRNCLIDFDSGELFNSPDLAGGSRQAAAWIKKNGIDAGGSRQPEIEGLIGFNIIAFPRPNQVWEQVSASTLAADEAEAFKLSKAGNPVFLIGKGGLPVTYIFRTRQGGMGILQIIGFTENPKGVKIRYKMVQQTTKGVSSKSQPATPAEGNLDHFIGKYALAERPEQVAWEVTKKGQNYIIQEGPSKEMEIGAEGLTFSDARERFSLIYDAKANTYRLETRSQKEPVTNEKPIMVSSLIKLTGQNSQPGTQAAENLTFGPVMEQMLYLGCKGGQECMINLDTGKTYTGLTYIYDSNGTGDTWLRPMKTEGIDVFTEMAYGESRELELVGLEMAVKPLDSEGGWDCPVPRLQDVLPATNSTTSQIISTEGQLPHNYAFRTREGGMGILQIVGFTENPKGVKIRYKMVQQTTKEVSSTSQPTMPAVEKP